MRQNKGRGNSDSVGDLGMWGEKPFKRHDWSAEFVHREYQITLPGGISNVTPEVSQMGQNVLVVN